MEEDPSGGTTHREQDTALATGSPESLLPGAPEGLSTLFQTHPYFFLNYQPLSKSGSVPQPDMETVCGKHSFSASLPNLGALPLKYLELTAQPLRISGSPSLAVIQCWNSPEEATIFSDFQFTLCRQSPVVKACGKLSVRVHRKHRQQTFKEMPAKTAERNQWNCNLRYSKNTD